jgi:hypothetical protein
MVPEGDWYKDSGSFKICGNGSYPKTFCSEGRSPGAKPFDRPALGRYGDFTRPIQEKTSAHTRVNVPWFGLAARAPSARMSRQVNGSGALPVSQACTFDPTFRR